MATIQEFPLAAFVVEAAFLGDTPVFALGNGLVRRVVGGAAEPVAVHTGAILEATVADGRLLTGGDDGVVALTSADGSVEKIETPQKKWIDHVAAGPNGVIAYSSGKTATLRHPDGRERAFEHKRSVGGLAFAPKGLRLAVARYDGVTLWWGGTESAAPVELNWKGAHLGAMFSPDGKYIVTTMQENALHGWRLGDGKDMRMTGYPAKPRSLSWSAKGRFLASSGAPAAILWPFHYKDGPMGRPPLQLGPREQLVTRVACHPREETVAIGYADGVVLTVRFADTKEVVFRKAGGSAVSALAWDKAGDRLLFGCEDGAAGIVTLAG
ncbi:MAG TPA: WD40 repeat domain-containing protein [Bauldia sp.]|nr:WD40 repeat domain-containing protein [Bauldia sp.]